MGDKNFWILMVLLAGALLPVQAGFNSRIGREISNPIWASIISFTVGLALLLLYAVFTKQSFRLDHLSNIPAAFWIAGGFGAFFITVSILAFPVLGAGLTFSLVVASQLFVSMLLDHYSLLVSQQQMFSWPRLLGLLLVVAGVVLIRKY